jgi:hypothetical protein
MKIDTNKNGKYIEDKRIVYYKNGLVHREDGPAIIFFNGDKTWYKNGKFNRINGPSIELSNGTKCWCQNGRFHKIDGPSIEYKDGSKYWFKNGLHHRIDGPAIEYNNGHKAWYINDKKYTEEEFYKKISQYFNIKLSNNDLNILQTLFSFYHLIIPEINTNIIIQLKEKFIL